jgi:hypothetical protein
MMKIVENVFENVTGLVSGVAKLVNGPENSTSVWFLREQSGREASGQRGVASSPPLQRSHAQQLWGCWTWCADC